MGQGNTYDIPALELAATEGIASGLRRSGTFRDVVPKMYGGPDMGREAPSVGGKHSIKCDLLNAILYAKSYMTGSNEERRRPPTSADSAYTVANAYADELHVRGTTFPNTPYPNGIHTALRPAYGLGGLATPQSPHASIPTLPPAGQALLMQPPQQQQQLSTTVGPARFIGGVPSYPQNLLPTPSPNRSAYPRRRSVTADASIPTGFQLSPEPRAPADVMYGNGPTKIDRELKKMNLYKTELCRSWEETGTCRYGTKCQFAHSEVELRPVDRHPKYKTEMCKTFWEKGTCPYGKRCCFIHTEKDVEKKMQDIDKKLLVLRRPSEDAAAGLMGEVAARGRTMSTGSIRTVSDESLDSPSHASAYDHRAIADAYFSGRRASADVNDGYAAPLPEHDVQQLSQMLLNAHLNSSNGAGGLGMSSYAEQRRMSMVDVRHDAGYSDGTFYPHGVHSAPLAGSHIYGNNGHLSEFQSNASGLTTPPRERTRRSRSVTQPTALITSTGRPWAKGRSESFSGYLPGSPLQIDAALSYLGVDPQYLSPHSPSPLYGSNSAKPYQQHHQLLSPPPSGHPSPVRETIVEEEGIENEEGADGQREMMHRLAVFKTIKRTSP